MSTPTSPLHGPSRHESAHGHVSGAARYVDDLPAPGGLLFGLPVGSPVARGRLRAVGCEAALAVPGVHAVLLARDVPGHNRIGAIVHDEPLLAEDELYAVGQLVALIVGESVAVCRAAAKVLVLAVDEAPAILSIADAIAADSYLGSPHVMRRGDVAAALARAALQLEGELASGGQDHFYLETQAALAIPGEDGALEIHSSTQHPTEVQVATAEILGCDRNRIVVQVPRMGGGFGGKESQATHFAALAALAALRLRRPVKVWLSRELDMQMTGKRHPFWSRWRAGFDAHGRLTAFEVFTYADGGWSVDLSPAILDRALFHLSNAYYIPNLRFEGRAVRTNTASNTAFRGFGGPQGMLVIEDAMTRAAERLGIDPAELRRRNYYGAEALQGDDTPATPGAIEVDAPLPEGELDERVLASLRDRALTPYYQSVEDCRLPRIHRELLAQADYAARRAEIEAFNARSPLVKRGLGFMPVKFGISFTNAVLNQAGALVLIYTDGSVQLNHGGTEMGQGLHSKMLAICAHELGVPERQIRVMTTATDKVPNTSATAASSGSDLNGAAVQLACAELRERLRPLAAELLGVAAPEQVGFVDGQVGVAGGPSISFAELTRTAWARRISLSAAGYYATPGIVYDREAGRGKPFHYFAYGAALTEVEVSGLTGEHRVLRVDILHDVGRSLLPNIDRGQIEGGYIQGLGWLTCEELVWDPRGHLLTHGPSTYKIPAVGDAPEDFRVTLLSSAPQVNVIHGSKAVGEPPLMLAISVIAALRHAIAGFGEVGVAPRLAIPCTPEAILRAIEEVCAPARATLVSAAE
ncbi:MAG: xanthine dehydrogenase molybdopterin binding subunit [Nannocystis sp.]|nr:xanthine dehydrogenase molybdopterin binding subunit [Nannocystis sp.]MBA3549703.1 xanthine dehydrogenase molybdopterin binding subunit [Nannocystis sp.]